MRSIEIYVDTVVGKVCAVYSMALKPDLNSVQRRVVGYVMRMSFRKLTKSPLKQLPGTVHDIRPSGSGAVKRDFYRPGSGRAHQSAPRLASLRGRLTARHQVVRKGTVNAMRVSMRRDVETSTRA